MKRSLALILALFSPLALTQSPKEAVESALKAAFGDWRGKTYQGLDRVVYFTPEGQETQVLRIRTYLDLGGCRLRLEIAPEGEKAPATLVYTRERQFLRLPDGRETPLDDRLFLELIFAWQTGFTGAAFGYDEVASLGKVTLPDGSEAEAYRVARRSHACLPKGVLEAKPYEGEVYVQEGKVVGEGHFSRARDGDPDPLPGPSEGGERGLSREVGGLPPDGGPVGPLLPGRNPGSPGEPPPGGSPIPLRLEGAREFQA